MHICTENKTKGIQFYNFVVTGGNVSCRNNNLWHTGDDEVGKIDDLCFFNKMAAIFQAIFSSAFSWMKIMIFWFQFLQNLYIRV